MIARLRWQRPSTLGFVSLPARVASSSLPSPEPQARSPDQHAARRHRSRGGTVATDLSCGVLGLGSARSQFEPALSAHDMTLELEERERREHLPDRPRDCQRERLGVLLRAR
jgi:hypothetical protein